MTFSLPSNDARPTPPSVDFSLVIGGPLYRLLRRSRLSGSELEMLGRRLAAVIVVAWLPLLVLSLLEGGAWHGTRVPFLRDFDVQTRLLVAVPLFFAAELLLHRRLQTALPRFFQRNLILDAQRDRFRAALDSAQAWLNSVWAEGLILVFVYAIGVGGVWRNSAALQMDTWYGSLQEGHLVPSMAGWWLGLVSLPIFQFLLLRWYFRLLVWWRLLWQISRLDLNLQPLHPDHAGGLGFLNQLSKAYVPLLMAQGAAAAGWIADQIFFVGARLPDFKLDLAFATAVAIFLIVGPLLLFTPALVAARRAGLGAYGNLATRYARDFDDKWLRDRAPAEEALVGSGDIQSLADLGNSYATLKEMRSVMFDTRSVLPLAVAVLAPAAPLMLTMVSMEELLGRLLQFLL